MLQRNDDHSGLGRSVETRAPKDKNESAEIFPLPPLKSGESRTIMGQQTRNKITPLAPPPFRCSDKKSFRRSRFGSLDQLGSFSVKINITFVRFFLPGKRFFFLPESNHVQRLRSGKGFSSQSPDIPETSFNCNDQQYPGLYADPEAECQVSRAFP